MDLYNPKGQTILSGQFPGIVGTRIRWNRNTGKVLASEMWLAYRHFYA